VDRRSFVVENPLRSLCSFAAQRLCVFALKRADVFTKQKRSEVMARIRSRGNRDTELALARLLRAHGITGWRRHVEVRGSSRSGGSVERRHSQNPSESSRRSAEAPLRSRAFSVRPDFVFSKQRVAVFVDGCFWHGCPKHATWPANRAVWWRRKIVGNKTRDALVTRTLRRAGWRVLRVWEHELAKKNSVRLAGRLSAAISG
jgi:DNA mismatch endonuclease (patch repair protein)